MEFQDNPYIVWQLIPAIATLWLGIYIQSRPKKKPESQLFSLLLYAGAFWSLANVLQLASPNATWQLSWHMAAFLAIVILPTAWFFLVVRFTGFYRVRLEKAWRAFLVIPGLTLLTILTNAAHHLFFSSYRTIVVDRFVTLVMDWGILFYIHTLYSYALLLMGVLILGMVLFRDFRRYGAKVNGLLLGVLTPLVVNIIYVSGALPPGFPDPTPISFTISAFAFAWAILAGHMLDVVPIAHGSVVTELASGIVVLDTDHKVLDINPAAVELLGVSSGDPVGRSFLDLVEHDPQLWKMVRAGLAQPGDSGQELVIERVEGKTNALRITGIHDGDDHVTGHLLQFIDISRQKQAEDSLANARENFNAILDTLKEYYFETDVTGVITHINQSFCEHLGYTNKDDLIGKHFRHFTNRQSVRDVFNNFNRIMETKKTIDLFEYCYQTRDGTDHVGETTISPILEGDQVIGARGVLREITARLASEAELRKTKEELEVQAEELAAINRITTIGNQTLELGETLVTLCEELIHIFPIRGAGINLLTGDGEFLELVAFHSVDPGEEGGLGKRISCKENRTAQEVLQHRRILVIPQIQADAGVNQLAGFPPSHAPAAGMVLPLLTHGRVIGILCMPAHDPGYEFTRQQIALAEIVAAQIAVAIENAQLHASTVNALDVVERDLEIGRQIQSGFFPHILPTLPGWEISAHFEPARQVAGDFYDFYPLENSNLMALVIADVCDKGVGAALFMTLFRSLLRAFSTTSAGAGVEGKIRSVIDNTNHYIAQVHGDSGMFATIFFGVLDPESGILYYVNGGHLPPAILNKDGKIIRRLEPTGPAVGIFPEAYYHVEQVALTPGDFLVGFTDGTSDAHNDKEEQFSEGRLLQYIQSPWTSLFSMIYELKLELKHFVGTEKQFDDIALIAVRRKLTPDCERHAICRVADNSALGEVKDFVAAAAAQCRLEPEDAMAFQAVAEEVTSKILQQGFVGREPGLLSLFFERDTVTTRLIIRDDGKFLSPGAFQSADFVAGLDGGLTNSTGIRPAWAGMDHASYSRMDAGGNQFTIEKKTHSPQPEMSWNP